MKFIFFTSLIALLCSCSAQKVSLSVTVHHPYCGGARPTPEMAAGRNEAASNMKLALFNKTTNEFDGWLELDANGSWSGKLDKGSYLIFREDKLLSSKELIKKYNLENTEFYQFKGEECLENWKKEVDFTLELNSKKSGEIELTFNAKCFVGLIPCYEYVGPKVN